MKEELIKKLKELATQSLEDPELAHLQADNLLIEFINDEDIYCAYALVKKYYA